MRYLGIDPGPAQTAYCVIDENYVILEADKVENSAFLESLRYCERPDHAAIESIQSYGMAVGREVFETCYIIGRCQEILSRSKVDYTLYPRQEYAKCIAGVNKVNDAVLRQALLLRFGGDKKDEPLWLLKGNGSDKRSAFAVAVYHVDKLRMENGCQLSQK